MKQSALFLLLIAATTLINGKTPESFFSKTSRFFLATLDEQDRKIMEKQSPQTVKRMNENAPLTINDIIKLSNTGISDASIIAYMEETRTIYTLTHTQIRRLQSAGVSERVIQFMVQTDKRNDSVIPENKLQMS